MRAVASMSKNKTGKIKVIGPSHPQALELAGAKIDSET